MAKKKDTGPLFEGMVLTEWQKFSNAIFGGFYRKGARNDKELMKTLAQADIRVMPEVYKATTLMSTIMTAIGCFGLLALVFAPGFGAVAFYENQQTAESVDPCIIGRSKTKSWLIRRWVGRVKVTITVVAHSMRPRQWVLSLKESLSFCLDFYCPLVPSSISPILQHEKRLHVETVWKNSSLTLHLTLQRCLLQMLRR